MKPAASKADKLRVIICDDAVLVWTIGYSEEWQPLTFWIYSAKLLIMCNTIHVKLIWQKNGLRNISIQITNH